ncbi:unnamed protein product [Gordionus sp. m RMFG-2023]
MDLIKVRRVIPRRLRENANQTDHARMGQTKDMNIGETKAYRAVKYREYFGTTKPHWVDKAKTDVTKINNQESAN